MAELVEYLKRAVQDGASDLFIVAGGKVSEKVEKTLYPISEENMTPQESERLITELYVPPLLETHKHLLPAFAQRHSLSL